MSLLFNLRIHNVLLARPCSGEQNSDQLSFFLLLFSFSFHASYDCAL